MKSPRASVKNVEAGLKRHSANHSKTTNKALSEHIESFIDTHGVKVEMDTNYILDVFTLRNTKDEDFSKIILVKESVKAKGTHVSYNDYILEQQDSIK